MLPKKRSPAARPPIKPHKKAKARRCERLEEMHARILALGRSPQPRNAAHLCEVVNLFYELAALSGLVKAAAVQM
jgi:hypothetical protein